MKVNPVALKYLRERSGYTKQGLARAVGVSTGTLADIESGRRNTSPMTARRLAQGLKVPLAAILHDCDESLR